MRRGRAVVRVPDATDGTNNSRGGELGPTSLQKYTRGSSEEASTPSLPYSSSPPPLPRGSEIPARRLPVPPHTHYTCATLFYLRLNILKHCLRIPRHSPQIVYISSRFLPPVPLPSNVRPPGRTFPKARDLLSPSDRPRCYEATIVISSGREGAM